MGYKLLCISGKIFAIICIFTLLVASFPSATNEPVSFLLDKVSSHDVVMLGTKHQCPPILHFIAQTLPALSNAGVTHVGLEIPSDQQTKIDKFIKEGKSLEDIEIPNIIDCPEYRQLLKAIRTHSLNPVACDLPRSMWDTPYTRDQWMAKKINKIFLQHLGAKFFMIVGNFHVIKKVEWLNVDSDEPFIRGYLSKYQPDLKIFSIAECIDDSADELNFLKLFGKTGEPVAVKTKGLDFKLGMLKVLAAKPMTAHEAVDAVIVF